MHREYVDIYKDKSAWNNLGTVTVADIKKHITPLINPLPGDELAKRFDLLVYTVDLAYLQKKNVPQPITSIKKTAEELSKLGTIPQVLEHKYLIEKVQMDEFWEQTDVLELEEVRLVLRELIKFIEKDKQVIYYPHFNDEIMEITEGEVIYDSNDLKNYRKKVQHYLQEHRDELAVFKLRNNRQLTKEDLKTLERIMWEELGSKDDYMKEFGSEPVGKLVRKLVGLDREAANEAFSKFISEKKLNSLQIRFVELIIDYVVTNGVIEDNSILMEDPFRRVGAITELFQDNMSDANEIMVILNEIRNNCEQIIS